MRPRHKAAENMMTGRSDDEQRRASMRPRHKAAENECGPGGGPARADCFNEAAA